MNRHRGPDAPVRAPGLRVPRTRARTAPAGGVPRGRTRAGLGIRGATSRYQGAALRTRERRPRRRLRRGWLYLAVAGLLAVAGGFTLAGPGARLWSGIVERVTALELGRAPVEVTGHEYLSATEVREAAGLEERVSFLDAPLDSAERRVSEHARVRRARVERRWNGRVRVSVEERVPAVLMARGDLREVDAEGVVLPPLISGVVADLPIVTGLEAPTGGRVEDPALDRALQWLRTLSLPAVGLGERVSEIDVRSDTETRLVLAPRGVRVLLPGEADEMETLSALRVVLADLDKRGVAPMRIDFRVPHMAIVKPAEPGAVARRSATGGDGNGNSNQRS